MPYITTTIKKKTVLLALVILFAALQTLIAYFTDQKEWLLIFLFSLLPLLFTSAIFYGTVPPSKKLVHGLLELIHKQIGIEDIRCSLLVPTGPEKDKNRRLWVQYRYPVTTTSSTFGISNQDMGNGIAGKAFRSRQFQQVRSVPVYKDGTPKFEFWEKDWNMTKEQTLALSYSGMRSVYCWPIFNSNGEPTAVLSIDSKQPNALSDDDKDKINQTFIPLIQKAFHTETQAGLRETIKEGLHRLGR
jgi:hypothetical protein